MGIFDIIDNALSGMRAERDQMDLIAGNIANINTTHTVAGGPYRRRIALFQEKNLNFDQFFVPAAFGESFGENSPSLGSGVTISNVVEDPAPPKLVYDPHNPDADEKGYVMMPNVDLITEMTNMMQANRAYEANAVVIETSKVMLQKALDISHYR